MEAVPQKGLTFNETASVISSFLEIALHTLLCIRQLYGTNTFVRKRAHGVPVYQSRHPAVKEYIAGVVKALHVELCEGTLRRMTVVLKSTSDGTVLERYIFDIGYMDLGLLRDGGRDRQEELSLLLRAFLIRLMALDTQLEDLKEPATFAIVIETGDGKEPMSNTKAEDIPPWTPASARDAMLPPRPAPAPAPAPAPMPADDSAHAPLLFVKAIDTGVIDMSLLVQENGAKRQA